MRGEQTFWSHCNIYTFYTLQVYNYFKLHLHFYVMMMDVILLLMEGHKVE